MLSPSIWFEVFDHIDFKDYKACVLAMPLFRQYLKDQNVIWRVLYSKIWKGEDDVDADEMFWYLQIPNLRGRLEPFHQNLQNRVQTITDLHKLYLEYREIIGSPVG